MRRTLLLLVLLTLAVLAQDGPRYTIQGVGLYDLGTGRPIPDGPGVEWSDFDGQKVASRVLGRSLELNGKVVLTEKATQEQCRARLGKPRGKKAAQDLDPAIWAYTGNLYILWDQDHCIFLLEDRSGENTQF